MREASARTTPGAPTGSGIGAHRGAQNAQKPASLVRAPRSAHPRTPLIRRTSHKFGFGHLCGVAERMDDAVAECGPEFYRLACAPGREETLLAPELAPDRGERIGEGGPPLAVPGRGRDLEPGVAAEAGGEQGHDGEQAE